MINRHALDRGSTALASDTHDWSLFGAELASSSSAFLRELRASAVSTPDGSGDWAEEFLFNENFIVCAVSIGGSESLAPGTWVEDLAMESVSDTRTVSAKERSVFGADDIRLAADSLSWLGIKWKGLAVSITASVRRVHWATVQGLAEVPGNGASMIRASDSG